MTQFALYDPSGAIAAICNSVPFHWDGDSASLSPRGWDWVLEKGMMNYEAGVTPNALSALSITIARPYLGQGLSARMVNALRDVARGEGLKHLVAPLRPMLKAIYPLTPMERYIRWKTPDGAPFDPWMRVHWRAGARIRHVCPESMRIPGSVSQWEEWTGIRFPESGLYIVPGALVPVEIHVEDDRGCYIEPNIWMVHTL
jgi:GNAT superfamily N-acetyltransferase